MYTAIQTTGELSENGRYERIMPRRDIDWFMRDNTVEGKYWMANVDKYVQKGEGHIRFGLGKGIKHQF